MTFVVGQKGELVRLIDADAFDERVRAAGGMSEEELSEDFKDGVQTVLYMMSKQPTITAQPEIKTDGDTISRQQAIDALNKEIIKRRLLDDVNDGMLDEFDTEDILRKLPSAQPEIKPIDYSDCANAMLKMWMDDVVTDGEYYKIMDKLNKFELKRREENDRKDDKC